MPYIYIIVDISDVLKFLSCFSDFLSKPQYTVCRLPGFSSSVRESRK